MVPQRNVGWNNSFSESSYDVEEMSIYGKLGSVVDFGNWIIRSKDVMGFQIFDHVISMSR